MYTLTLLPNRPPSGTLLLAEDTKAANTLSRLVSKVLSKEKLTAQIQLRVLLTVGGHARIELELLSVRLTKKRPYCGNHAGPCPAGGPKKRDYTFLEALDWIRFNNALNKALDASSFGDKVDIHSKADVEHGSPVHIRRAGVGRRKWQYLENPKDFRDRRWIAGPYHAESWLGDYEDMDECVGSFGG